MKVEIDQKIYSVGWIESGEWEPSQAGMRNSGVGNLAYPAGRSLDFVQPCSGLLALDFTAFRNGVGADWRP